MGETFILANQAYEEGRYATAVGLYSSLVAAGGDRLHVCAGAVGGLDLVRAAAAMGPVERAAITTTKKPAGLVQDHMDADERDGLLALTERTVLFAR